MSFRVSGCLSCRRPLSVFRLAGLCGFALIAVRLFGQEWAINDRLSLPTDWSFSHVIYSRGFPAEMAPKMKNDPRLYHSWALQGHLPMATAASSRIVREDRGRQTPQPHRDWSFSLGSGTVARNMSPAKFNFNINETVSASSCTGASADFVVYGLNVAGTGTDAKASGVFTGQPVNGSVLTITVNGTAFLFTANNSANSSSSYQRSGTVSTDATNLAAAIGLNSGLNALVTSVANSPTSGEVALTAKAVGGTITIAATSGNPNFGSINSTPGTSAQSNLVALQNLYSAPSGGLCGTAPSEKWAYNVTTLTNGAVTTSPVLSLDGAKVAFVESNGSASVLHILKWKDLDGTVSSPATDLTSSSSIGTCTAPCMVSLTYDGSHGNSNSSPFYNYQAAIDTLYVGADGGTLYAIAPVFNGTSAPVVTHSVAVASGTVLSAPVLDFTSGNLFVGSSNGNLYAVNASTFTVSATHLAVGSGAAVGGGITDGPLIDGSTGRVFAYSASNVAFSSALVPTSGLSANNSGVVVEADTTTPFGSETVAVIGNATSTAGFNLHAGAFDNNYYTSPASGHLFMCAVSSGTSNTLARLYMIPFNGSNNMSPGNLSGSLNQSANVTSSAAFLSASNPEECSPISEIFSGSDRLFFGSGSAGVDGQANTLAGSGAGGAFQTSDASNFTTASSVTEPASQGGTSAIVVDNLFSPPAWAALTTYASGALILDSNGNVQQCTTSGTSKVAPHPTWSTTYNGTTGDGTVVWTEKGTNQAASFYFGTLATSANCGTGVFCAVKLTQSTLQ